MACGDRGVLAALVLEVRRQSEEYRFLIRRPSRLAVSVAAVVLAALVFVSSAGATPRDAQQPTARVGAYYFDGWAGSLNSYHFTGLFGPPFSSWRPLYGWRDAAPSTLERQLDWAHEFGIDFFLFDWYHKADDGGGDTNSAIKNYVRLEDHGGVSFALTYINNEAELVIPRSEWPAVCEEWVTQYFSNPDYVRVAGMPLFEVHDVTGMTLQYGGTGGVNWALDTLRQVAKAHGLPGVYIVGGVYVDSLFDWSVFPRGVGGDPEAYSISTGTPSRTTAIPQRPVTSTASSPTRNWSLPANRCGTASQKRVRFLTSPT
jgi:hypothetical protein